MATTLLCARSSSLLVCNSSVSLRSIAPSLAFRSPHLHNQPHYCHFLSSFAFSGALGVRRFCPSRRSVSSWWCRADLSTTAGVVEAEGVVVEEKKEDDEKNDDDGFRGSVPAFQKRLRIADIKGGPQGGLERVGEYMLVRGWVRTCRSQKTFAFIEVNDGSAVSNLQAVVNTDVEGYNEVEAGRVTTGASVSIEGVLVESQGSKQKVELQASKLLLV
jgi:hypothetical protein